MPKDAKDTKRTKVSFGTKFITVEDSKVIDRVYYDPQTDTLDAVFSSGKRYRYREVPPKVFAEFVLAKSMGAFFNKEIRNTFQYQPVL